ncbi:global regulatory protein [soil metagenome]
MCNYNSYNATMAVLMKQAVSPSLPAQPNQSLLDGLVVLQTLATTGSPMGGRELARQLGWNPMRVNRLLKTLAFAGMARQTPDRRYVAGPAMHVLSVQSLFASGLLRRSIEPVEKLPRGRFAVALGVLWREQVCYLFHAGAGQPLTSALGTHMLYPSTQSSTGMALLSHQSPDTIDALFTGRPTPGYASLKLLKKKLFDIRKLGYAYIVQREKPHQASLAVTIGSPAYAGLALSNVRESEIAALLPQLQSAAEQIGQD